ncbi:hypothetical protein SO802_005405 [Lithocarpus litseifolius]|uniref:Uncharacterized protein n=1 Tax=Lithocarpus litseifolius TaxID=425828 RepID=A0AAW2DI32_9ROSI
MTAKLAYGMTHERWLFQHRPLHEQVSYRITLSLFWLFKMLAADSLKVALPA